MTTNEETITLFNMRYWKAWWKVHVETVPTDRLLENAVRRAQYQWAAAPKQARDRAGKKTKMSSS